MARVGSFIGPTEYYGAPLAIVHPLDNQFPMFDPEIDKLNISDEEKAKLQQQVDELQAALQLGRDLPA